MNTPEEYNLLNNVQFKLDIHRLPNVTFYMQNAMLPSVQLDSPRHEIARLGYQLPGTKLNFDPLNVTFLVDQDLANYIELYRWMLELPQVEPTSNQVSEATLHFLTGNMNVNKSVRFVGLFPQLVSELAFSSSDPDVDRIECTITFGYRYFTFFDDETDRKFYT